ncbi:MAG: TIGR00730 family Rossman fold protein [Pseudomonadales bacterium]
MNICVFCGSSSGARPDYQQAAVALGQALVERGVGLVYGGASVGLMGTVADAVLEAGGEVIGVIPQSIADVEIAHRHLTELHVVESMHARKALMADRSAGFVALPGGIGTLEEIFEVWTWSQLGIHAKPLGFLNVAGYYDALALFLDQQVTEGFVKPGHRAIAQSAAEAGPLLELLLSAAPPTDDKWTSQHRP